MKIGVDVGALCSKNRYGNYIVSKNFIEAINFYDRQNEYYLYSFCDKPIWLKTNKNIRYLKLIPKYFWMNFRLSLEEIINKKDIFLALNQAIPLITPAKIISFCHGLSYYFYPQYYPDSYQKLKAQLEMMVKKSSYIIVSSQMVKEELISIYRYIEEKIKVLPFGIPFDINSKLYPTNSGLRLNPVVTAKAEIQNYRDSRFRHVRGGFRGNDKVVENSRLKVGKKYFLFVGMEHPIKNIDFIKTAFEEFKKDREFRDYKLYLVTKNISREKLKQLYQDAVALLTASFYESFNLPVLEALSLGCPVIGLSSAIIPELKEYVNLAQSREEFLSLMKKAAFEHLKEINRYKLISTFSWENYIKNLTKLYFCLKV